MSNFRPVEYVRSGVGRRIKRTKVKHTWKFYIDQALHLVHFFDSKISGRRKVFVNGEMVLQTKRSSGRDPLIFCVDSHIVAVAYDQTGNCDLHYDNVSFSALAKKEAGKENEKHSAEVKGCQAEALRPSAKPAALSQSLRQPVSSFGGRSEFVFDLLAPPLSKQKPVKFSVECSPEECVPQPVHTKLDFKSNLPPPKQLAEQLQVEEPKALTVEDDTQPPEILLFDIDNLHLGDEYSPAVMKKLEEAMKPAVVIANAPNVPMNQLQTQRAAQQGLVYMPQQRPS